MAQHSSWRAGAIAEWPDRECWLIERIVSTDREGTTWMDFRRLLDWAFVANCPYGTPDDLDHRIIVREPTDEELAQIAMMRLTRE